VIGEMALLDHAPRMATVRAVRSSKVLRIRGDTFEQMISQSPSAALSMMQTVTKRLRQNEALLRQNEKMAALGTLAAGWPTSLTIQPRLCGAAPLSCDQL